MILNIGQIEFVGAAVGYKYTLWLLQNAMRATMELHEDAMHYPPVHVRIALGDEDLTVKVWLNSWCLYCIHLTIAQITETYRFCSKYPPDVLISVDQSQMAQSNREPSVMLFSHRSVIVGEEFHWGRLTGCLHTPTLQPLVRRWTHLEPLLWSVPHSK